MQIIHMCYPDANNHIFEPFIYQSVTSIKIKQSFLQIPVFLSYFKSNSTNNFISNEKVRPHQPDFR
jgi:hypothetical protein